MVNSFPLTMKMISSQIDLLQITFSAFPQSLWTQLNERNFHLFSFCTLLDCEPLCPCLGFERVNTFHEETVSGHLTVVKHTKRTHKKMHSILTLTMRWSVQIRRRIPLSFSDFWWMNRGNCLFYFELTSFSLLLLTGKPRELRKKHDLITWKKWEPRKHRLKESGANMYILS